MTELEMHLHDEIEKGRRAQIAYDNFLKQYIEHLRAECMVDFINCTGNATELALIWQRMQACGHMETDIKTDIETGRLASMQLNKEK